MTAPLIALAAGGTGGHMFPAEALAAALLARGYRLALITDKRGAAYRGALAQIETHALPVSSLAGGVVKMLRGGFDLAISVVKARGLLRRLSPRVVVGFGGYPSVPPMLAARQLGIATALHEQNAVLGRANRLVARGAAALATSFPDVRMAPEAARGRITLTGNPVRPAALSLRDTPYAPLADGKLRIVVTGGSQGATIFSRVVPGAVAALDSATRAKLEIVQQCRAEDLAAARAAYQSLGVAAELASFFDDLPQRIARAGLVICRAGASTTSELAVIGRPAILVPYPHAMDDHQTANAAALAQRGAGWLVPDVNFTAQYLAEQLTALLDKPSQLTAAAAAMRALGQPQAAERLADVIARLAPANGNTTHTEKAA